MWMISTMNNKMKQVDVWQGSVLFKGFRLAKQCPVIIVGNELALDADIKRKNIVNTASPSYLRIGWGVFAIEGFTMLINYKINTNEKNFNIVFD